MPTSLMDKLRQPVDAASLSYFRIIFGLIMIWEVWRYSVPKGGGYNWIETFYIWPEWFFKYYGFEWVEPWPGIGMYLHFAVIAISATMLVLGLFYRIAAIVLFLSFTYVFLLDQARYLNHFYFVSLIIFLLCWLPANRHLSLDAKLGLAKADNRVPYWAVLAPVVLFEVVLIYAGIVKVNGDWLNLQPLTMWLGSRTHLCAFQTITDFLRPWIGDVCLVGPLLSETWVVAIASYFAIAVHLLGAPLLLWKKTRFWIFWFYVFFHLMNAWLWNIGIFPWLTIAGTLMFFDPGWPRQLWAWLKNPGFYVPPAPPVSEAPLEGVRAERFTVAFLTLFVAFNILYPLRHYLYPGDVAWTEEGHRFAWRMKLRSKDAIARFVVRDPETGREWRVENANYLTYRQQRKMPTRPDMVLQFAHRLADIWQTEHGVADPEVYATVWCSLNGRTPQLLIDPERDLADVPRELWPAADWILPLTEELPSVW